MPTWEIWSRNYRMQTEELRNEIQRKDETLKGLEYQTSLRKSIELAFETQKDLIKSKEDNVENMKMIPTLSNVTEPVNEGI